ncbi:AEC family transporter [Solibacillus sp. FSL K6-1523]|uniref:AEC family transporter n=1 Tax=Solibacillus sp. FSL K6-1523 TaxID=2921471 RepID=UPI0030F5FBDD
MDLGIVFQSIFLIALLIFLGSIVARFYVFNEDTKKMYITLITNVAMPSIILSSIFSVEIDQKMVKTLGLIFVFSIIINLIGLLIGFLATIIFKKYTARSIEVAILSAFGNTGFIGIPLCAVLFGPEGALYAAIFDAGVDFTIWTFGVYFLQQEKRFSFGLLKSMVNLPLIAIVLGLLIAVSGIQVPILVTEFTGTLAALAVPLAMFYIGATVNTIRSARVRISYFEVMVPVFIKLVLLPLIVVFIINVNNLKGLLINVIIIQSMMPALTLSSVLFAKYSRDYKMGALVTIVSTIASLLIIPVMLYFINEYLIHLS